jgi:L-aspartate oxidase
MNFDVPRYLVAFHPKQIPHHFADVLIIGGGIAGLRAAMEIDPKLSLLVITKDSAEESNSNYAQGGIAGVLDPEDRFENHVADTIAAGAGLCDEKVVELVVRDAPQHIRQLIDWGTKFDRQDGELLLGREGGHSHHRIVHALGDATGREIMRTMISRAQTQLGGNFWPNTFTIDLLTHNGVCCGALVWHADHGRTFVWAKQTILCTGGAGQLYRETTNPPVATGDGQAIAYRAGARLADMEFVQFHPTVLYIAGSSRSLITEAMRGEGAKLIDCNGLRFMPEYDERGELAPRDVVSQAIVAQMEKTRHPNVYLDLSHLDAAFIGQRFPGIAKTCAEFGINIATDPIPVRPGAHYMIGGVQVDIEGRTSLPGLWAAGEVSSSGLHGANRLASNSLLEGLVYGARAGAGATAEALAQPDNYQAIPLENPELESPREPLDLVDIRNSLKSLTWRSAGVRRNRQRLQEAAETIDQWCRYVLTRQLGDPEGWELQNMLTVSRLIIAAALDREESRGVHLRTDFPDRDDEHWLRRISTVRQKNEADSAVVSK